MRKYLIVTQEVHRGPSIEETVEIVKNVVNHTFQLSSRPDDRHPIPDVRGPEEAQIRRLQSQRQHHGDTQEHAQRGAFYFN